MPVEIRCCWSSDHENSNTPSTRIKRTGRTIAPSISAEPSLSRHSDCSMDINLPVQLHHVVVHPIGRLNETQELGIGACAGCCRQGQEELAEARNRNITRVTIHWHGATAAI